MKLKITSFKGTPLVCAMVGNQDIFCLEGGGGGNPYSWEISLLVGTKVVEDTSKTM